MSASRSTGRPRRVTTTGAKHDFNVRAPPDDPRRVATAEAKHDFYVRALPDEPPQVLNLSSESMQVWPHWRGAPQVKRKHASLVPLARGPTGYLQISGGTGARLWQVTFESWPLVGPDLRK